jgi:DNA-directed RNA polymerase specialized sigma24 family protein
MAKWNNIATSETPSPENLMSPNEDTSDEDLMRHVQKEGDKQSFAILYDRYYDSVVSYLLWACGDDAFSLAQEVFLTAFNRISTYRYPRNALVWIFTIARKVVLNWSQRDQDSGFT